MNENSQKRIRFSVKWSSFTLRYGFAVVCAVIMLVLSGLLIGPLEGVVFSIPLAVIAVVALTAGAGPGLLFSVIVGIGTWYFFQEPLNSFAMGNRREVVRLVSYFTAGLIIVATIDLLHRTRLHLTAARIKAENILNAITEGFIEFDGNWEFIDVNNEAEKLLGMSRDKLIGRICWEVLRGMGTEVEQRLTQAVDKKRPEHFEIFYHPWSRWFEIHAYPTEEDGLALYFRDITTRKNAEKSLRESEESLRAFFDHAALGAAELDLSGRFLRVNDRFCQMTGFGREELLAMTPFEMTHPEDRKRDWELYLKFKERLAMVYEVQSRYIRKDGSILLVQVHGALVQDINGQQPRTVAIFTG